MSLTSQSTVAELRSELDRKRRRALDLQAATGDAEEWAVLNTLRWELEDLDRDLYQGQFIRNNDRLEKLVAHIESATDDAQRILRTLDEVRAAVSRAREKIRSTSSIFGEMDAFLVETETLLDVIRA